MACNDDMECNVKGEVKILASSNQQQHNHNKEACTPFCQCTCCAGFSINHTIVSVPAITVPPSKGISSFLPDNIREISLPIWQPPQL